MIDNNLYYKYANLLLKKGLALKEKQPLVISAPIESIDFIRVLTEVACELGIKDIYYDWYDDELKHTLLKNYEAKDIKKSMFWNKKIHDKYAKKDAAFLFLIASNPGIMKDIDSHKLKIASLESLTTRKLYRTLQSNNQISWCIASVATDTWSKLIFPNSANPKEDLWNLIFDICLINEEDPITSWNKKIADNKNIYSKLNDLKIKTLHYQNGLGTDLKVTLANNALWCNGASVINNQELIVNIPTEEVFTTPNKYYSEGVVYTSIPLIHNGITIENIKLSFQNGKVTSYSATSGLDELKNIIETDEESSMLGEIALVDKLSKIASSHTLFYETLYDENASCHLALGRGFKECLLGGDKLSDDELENIGYNKSKNHIDMMIGTDDLTIIATTYDNQEIIIFKDGSFNI